MPVKKENHVLELDSVSRITPWLQAATRLKNEHYLLTGQLLEIQATAKAIYMETDSSRVKVTLKILKVRVTGLMNQLSDHSEWEERELFPTIDLYYRRLMKPSITPSIWVMEKDHELAELFARSFVRAVDALPEAATMEQNLHAAAHLMQVCLILLEHFELEEELIFPLANEMLTDIDYFYS